jgi:putative colanic acid biosynthesis UDP-glucose lipid carrier transferase
VTRIGSFLRRTSLDELPQLVNVLRGEMSLVGPRPEMPFIVGHIKNDMEDPVYHLRFDTKPGITGLWQVSSARKAPIQENIDYDLYYLENQSVFLDIVILFLTVLAVLRIRDTF